MVAMVADAMGASERCNAFSIISLPLQETQAFTRLRKP
jgi:hypothetical protein